MSRILTTLFISGLLLISSGCSQFMAQNNNPTWQDATRDELIQTNYAAAERLIKQTQEHHTLMTTQPLIMATIVNIDKLDRSSTLGRLISEQVAARFTQMNYEMTEVKLRNQLYLKQEQGELMLTRELKEIATTHNAQAVIVGTYAISQQLVFVNLKIIQPANNLVLSSTDYAIPLDNNIRALLGLTK